MNRLKKYRGLIKKTWFATTGITLLVLLFGVPSFPRFQKTGDNFYKVSINGTEIGNSSDPEEVERLVAEARREITETEGTMVYIPVEITSEGQELLFGNTDSRHNLYKAIYDVLKSSISTTLQHAYTVKINEYTVNLGSSSDVRALLQAALDRYDTEHAYRADIVIDPDRQLNVLTTSVSKKDDSTGQLQHAAGEGAGADPIAGSAPSASETIHVGVIVPSERVVLGWLSQIYETISRFCNFFRKKIGGG